MSRIGKKPVSIPQGVTVKVQDNSVYVEGPKGQLTLVLSARIHAEVKDNQVFFTRVSDIKTDKALHGLFRSLVNNMIKGVSDGYVKELEIQGVGFKAQVQGNKLTLNLGFSHPVHYIVPEGVKIEAPKATQLVIRGIDKEKVGEVAAEIRSVYPPEPYKGKGIRYVGEYVRRKVGKAQAQAGAK
jgi:large subunit ribosomal protein L6